MTYDEFKRGVAYFYGLYGKPVSESMAKIQFKEDWQARSHQRFMRAIHNISNPDIQFPGLVTASQEYERLSQQIVDERGCRRCHGYGWLAYIYLFGKGKDNPGEKRERLARCNCSVGKKLTDDCKFYDEMFGDGGGFAIDDSRIDEELAK